MRSIHALRAFNLIAFGGLLLAGFVVLFFKPAEMMDRYLAFANFSVKLLLPSFVAGAGGAPLKKLLDNQGNNKKDGEQ